MKSYHRPIFITWHNPPNRPTLAHIIFDSQPQTLCGARPVGTMYYPELVQKEIVCPNCVKNYDQLEYETTGLIDYLYSDIQSSRFGISAHQLGSLLVELPESKNESDV